MLHLEELHYQNETSGEKMTWVKVINLFDVHVESGERKEKNEPSQVVLAGKIKIIFSTAELSYPN